MRKVSGKNEETFPVDLVGLPQATLFVGDLALLLPFLRYGLLPAMMSLEFCPGSESFESDWERRILSLLLCGLFLPCFTAGSGEEGDHGCFVLFPILGLFCRTGLFLLDEFLPGELVLGNSSFLLEL